MCQRNWTTGIFSPHIPSLYVSAMNAYMSRSDPHPQAYLFRFYACDIKLLRLIKIPSPGAPVFLIYVSIRRVPGMKS